MPQDVSRAGAGTAAEAAAASAGGAEEAGAAGRSTGGTQSVLDAETEARLSSYRAHSRELESRLADKDRDIQRLDQKVSTGGWAEHRDLNEGVA
jgi:hypothetical protein